MQMNQQIQIKWRDLGPRSEEESKDSVQLSQEFSTPSIVGQRHLSLRTGTPESDPLGKREVSVIAHRKARKDAILSSKRKDAAASQLELFFCNARGFNGQWKQEVVTKHLLQEFQLVMLAETKLTKMWQPAGWSTMQTQKRRNGGCLIAAKDLRMRRIKSLNTSIAWATIIVAGSMVHCLTCFVEPNNSAKREIFLVQLGSIMRSMKCRDPEAKAIVAGDFNDARDLVDTIMENSGFREIVDKAQPTHNKGGKLDQVYTNLEVLSHSLREVHHNFTDHKGIALKVRVPAWKVQRSMNQTTTQPISIGEIRRAVCKESTIKALLQREFIIGEEALTAFKDGIQLKPKNQRWYKPTITQVGIDDEQAIAKDLIDRNKENWRLTLRQLESLHKEGDWKNFFTITKRITKIDQGGRPIKGLLEGDEEILASELIDCKLAQHFKKLYNRDINLNHDMCEHNKEFREGFFNLQEIQSAIEESNFDKGIGPDGFCGKILLTNAELKARVEREVADALNTGRIPGYLRRGRLTALSKIVGKDVVKIDDIRPIVIRPHVTKIMEKSILNKIKSKHSQKPIAAKLASKLVIALVIIWQGYQQRCTLGERGRKGGPYYSQISKKPTTVWTEKSCSKLLKEGAKVKKTPIWQGSLNSLSRTQKFKLAEKLQKQIPAYHREVCLPHCSSTCTLKKPRAPHRGCGKIFTVLPLRLCR